MDIEQFSKKFASGTLSQQFTIAEIDCIKVLFNPSTQKTYYIDRLPIIMQKIYIAGRGSASIGTSRENRFIVLFKMLFGCKNVMTFDNEKNAADVVISYDLPMSLKGFKGKTYERHLAEKWVAVKKQEEGEKKVSDVMLEEYKKWISEYEVSMPIFLVRYFPDTEGHIYFIPIHVQKEIIAGYDSKEDYIEFVDGKKGYVFSKDTYHKLTTHEDTIVSEPIEWFLRDMDVDQIHNKESYDEWTLPESKLYFLTGNDIKSTCFLIDDEKDVDKDISLDIICKCWKELKSVYNFFPESKQLLIQCKDKLNNLKTMISNANTKTNSRIIS